MATYTVEMFGLPYSISGIREIKFEHENGAKLTDVIGALRRKIPALEGEVITPGNDFLMDGFTFNINGFDVAYNSNNSLNSSFLMLSFKMASLCF